MGLLGNETRLGSSVKSTKMCEFEWEGDGERGKESTHIQHMDVQKWLQASQKRKILKVINHVFMHVGKIVIMYAIV